MKSYLSIILFTCFLFAACTQTGNKPDTTGPAASGNDSGTLANNIAEEKLCYELETISDTVVVQLAVHTEVVTGTMFTSYSGKDKNTGTLAGIVKGDTIYADYTFQSEGIQSVREVAFLKKGNLLLQGFGEVTEKAGKTIFSNAAGLKFDSNFLLMKQTCK